jgi:hypothetical protein
MVSMKKYLSMTTAERRAEGAKQAVKTRARTKLSNDYCVRFGDVSGVLDEERLRLMRLSLETGIDQLVAAKKEEAKRIAAYDRKQAKFLKTPITAKTEQEYTGLIKQRRLYEGACDLAWEQYFKFRDKHSDCEPLSRDDLTYAGLWTACAFKAAKGL